MKTMYLLGVALLLFNSFSYASDGWSVTSATEDEYLNFEEPNLLILPLDTSKKILMNNSIGRKSGVETKTADVDKLPEQEKPQIKKRIKKAIVKAEKNEKTKGERLGITLMIVGGIATLLGTVFLFTYALALLGVLLASLGGLALSIGFIIWLISYLDHFK